jgi:predicted RNA binding protein YcfA (HicA-like mRNA interferase family)
VSGHTIDEWRTLGASNARKDDIYDDPLVFPSLKAQKLLAILQRKPLEYEIVRQEGSHRVLESPNGYPRLLFSFHDKQTLPSGLIRKILVKDVGLTLDEAKGLL